MTVSESRAEQNEGGEAPGAEQVQEVAAWAGQLVRTLKTCRLYDEGNPTVVRFREGLAESLLALTGKIGPLRLDVGTTTLSWAGHEVLAAHSRDDNLAGALHRDGIRLLEPAKR